MATVGPFNLSGPPRHVPILLRLRVLFGGFMSQFGWIFFGFGLSFVWAFTLNSDVTSWYHFRGDLVTATGTVLYSEKTKFSEGGSNHRKGTPVYANHYSFAGPNAVVYKGVSYATAHRLEKGKQVTIEYPRGKPEISRIKGMRRRPMGAIGLMPFVFPLIGLVFIILGIRKGIKGNRLLAYGQLGTGRLKSKVSTSTKVNGQPVYKLTFEFVTPEGGTYETVAKTHEPEKLEDEAEEPLLYDPVLPSYAVMLDNLPGSPRIDESGNTRAGSALSAFLSLVIPAASILGHAGYMCFKLLS